MSSYDAWKTTDPADADPYRDTDCPVCRVPDGYQCAPECDCADCLAAAKAADYEPPEPDGEAFRGREAESFNREQMARIQRELK